MANPVDEYLEWFKKKFMAQQPQFPGRSPSTLWNATGSNYSDTPGVGMANQFDRAREKIPEQSIGLNAIPNWFKGQPFPSKGEPENPRPTLDQSRAYNNPEVMRQLYMQNMQMEEEMPGPQGLRRITM